MSALAADTATVGNVMIHEPWARASIGNAPNSAAYMTLEIMGEASGRLVGGSSPVAEKAVDRPVDGEPEVEQGFRQKPSWFASWLNGFRGG